jgi:hypothetical protein
MPFFSIKGYKCTCISRAIKLKQPDLNFCIHVWIFFVKYTGIKVLRAGVTWEASDIYSGCGRVVQGTGRKVKRLVLQCINGVSSNPVEGRTKIWQLKNLILTLFGLIFRRIYIYIQTNVRLVIGSQDFRLYG